MKAAYSYTILRYVHDTATGEFVNVGVAILAPEFSYASALCRTTYGRLAKTFPGMDGESFKALMRFIQSRFEEIGDQLLEELPFDGVPKSVMDLAYHILPPDDSSLQWSPPGGGLTENPSQTLELLFERMVTRYDERLQQERRSDEDVWRTYKRSLESRHLLKFLQPKKITVLDDELEFEHAWKNGAWHCLEPVSFDLSSADSIRDKAHRWLGQLTSISNSSDLFKVYLLLGEPQLESLKPAFSSAISILRKLPVEAEIVREQDADMFTNRFALEIEKHEGVG